MTTPGTAPDPQILDLGHLARQTFGDADLEREVLGLFEEQCGRLLPVIAGEGDAAVRADAAHTLKGAARAVGAWRVGEAADAVEHPLRASGPSPGVEAIAALRHAIGQRCGATA